MTTVSTRKPATCKPLIVSTTPLSEGSRCYGSFTFDDGATIRVSGGLICSEHGRRHCAHHKAAHAAIIALAASQSAAPAAMEPDFPLLLNIEQEVATVTAQMAADGFVWSDEARAWERATEAAIEAAEWFDADYDAWLDLVDAQAPLPLPDDDDDPEPEPPAPSSALPAPINKNSCPPVVWYDPQFYPDSPAGYVYLVELDQPYQKGLRVVRVQGKLEVRPHYVSRYLGWAIDPWKRYDQHLAGKGARLLAHLAGIGWPMHLEAVAPGGRDLEAALKRRHNNAKIDICRRVA